MRRAIGNDLSARKRRHNIALCVMDREYGPRCTCASSHTSPDSRTGCRGAPAAPARRMPEHISPTYGDFAKEPASSHVRNFQSAGRSPKLSTTTACEVLSAKPADDRLGLDEFGAEGALPLIASREFALLDDLLVGPTEQCDEEPEQGAQDQADEKPQAEAEPLASAEPADKDESATQKKMNMEESS